MKKNKLVITLIIVAIIAFNASSPTNAASKPSSKPLRATVEDYRLQYINKDWWDKFNDPVLKQYILKAVSNNYDLKIISLRVKQAGESARESLGREFPTLDINGDFSRRKTSENVSMGSFKIRSYSQNSYNFPIIANYELDLWLKNRDKTLSMKKQLESAIYDEKTAYIALCSEVAGNYFNLVSTDKQLQLQEEIINLRKEILELTKESYNLGLYSASEVTQADKAYTEAQSVFNDLKKAQAILLNHLAVLTGESSNDSSRLDRESIDRIDLLKSPPESLNSDIVRERPDILKAEAQLQKAKIDVKIARKDFLPEFSIIGQFGFNANSLSKVFNWNSYVSSIGVNLFQGLFSGGQRSARLKLKKYQYDEMLNSYQKTILTSFQEVNDSLASLKFDYIKNNDTIKRIEDEKENFRIINNKYTYGAISYLDTLQYKERLISLEKEQIQNKTLCLIDLLSLYKSAGGKL